MSAIEGLNEKENAKFIESTAVPGVKGIAVVNPDGSNIGGGSNTLPTGAATSAKQDTGNTSLASIDSKLDALTTPSDTQPVSASNLDIRDLSSASDSVTVANTNSTPVYTQPTSNGVVSERVTNTDGNSTAFSNFGATTSTYNYIKSIVVYNSSATAGYVDFRDGTGGAVLWTMPLPAGGGAVISSETPLFKTGANTALAFDVSAALSTVYISISGYRSTT